MRKGYLVIDVGTGNTRAAVITTGGHVVSQSSIDTKYIQDDKDSCYFEPQLFWKNIASVVKEVLSKSRDVRIISITATSTRQGAVLLDKNGNAIIGLPNIDNRGAYLEGSIKEDYVYMMTGKWAVRYFTAFKIVSFFKSHKELARKVYKFTSISDWIGYMFTGVLCYEHTQACETLLYDTEKGGWNSQLCELFEINSNLLPNLVECKNGLGNITAKMADWFGLEKEVVYVVSSGDTQVALQGVNAKIGDLGIVAGTTTPVVLLTDKFVIDKRHRCWVNKYIGKDQFMLETSAGVTGLNYQRFKRNFLGNYSYQEIEQACQGKERPQIVSCLSTIDFETNTPFNKGTFQFQSPLSVDITAIDMAYALILDMAFGIKKNYDVLTDITKHDGRIVGAGGGLQSPKLCQSIADLTKKELVLMEGYENASLLGCVKNCNHYWGIESKMENVVNRYEPDHHNEWIEENFLQWCKLRQALNAERS